MTWHVFRDDPGYLADRADGLLASAADGTPSAVAEFTRWAAPRTTEGARLVLARAHGFADWPSFVLPSASAAAFRSVEARDVDGLAALVDRFPDVVGVVGTTALHHAAEGGHVEVIEVLLAAGADPSIEDDLHGATAAGRAGRCGQAAARDLLRQLS